MTRRLGGIQEKSLAALACLSLAASLACGIALTGCGGDSSVTPSDDGGDGGDGGTLGDAKPDVTGMDVTMDADGGPGPDVRDTGPADGDATMALPACGTPTFMPNGGSITSGTPVTIVPPGAPFMLNPGNIFYTLDNTLPTHASQLYNGPIQVSATQTIRAIAFDQGVCTDSALAVASFAVTLGDGGLTGPTFNPPSVTQGNDFTLALSSSPGATICYTLDGVTTPTCNLSTAACTNSTTYNPGTGISINGTITNATTGQVKVQAIACAAGSNPTAVVSQTYGLKVGAPSFQAPAPSTVAYTSAGTTATISTATISSTTSSTTNVPFIRYTTDGSTPTCAVGTMPVVGGGVGVGNSGTVNFTQSTSFMAIACKNGYAPSDVTTGAYNVQLNVPGVQAGTGTYYDLVSVGLSATLNGTTAIQNPGGTWICYSTSGAASCGTTSMACGATSTRYLSTAGMEPIVTTTGTVVNAVTCSPDTTKFISSMAMASQTYTLQLRPVVFSPPTGTPIPSGMMLSVNISEDNTGAPNEPWTSLCYTTDGVTAPDCTCTGANQNLVTPPNTTVGNTWATAVVGPTTTSVTLSVIGCATGFLSAGVTSANYPNAGTMAQPTILPPVTPVINNDTPITFVNNDATEMAHICWALDAGVPACAAASSALCTADVAHGATTAAGPTITATGTAVHAIACDAATGAGKLPSSAATSTYILQAAQPTIAPNSGTVRIGQTITFTSATASTIASPVTFFFSTTGGAPPVCGSGTSVQSAAGATSSATYQITGLETGPIQAVACRTSYTQSPVGTATYSGFTAETPVLAYGTGTYNDYLTVGIQATSTSNGSYWLCYSAGANTPATCGASADACSAGTPIAHAALSSGNCTGSPNAPNTLTGLCGVPSATLPDTAGGNTSALVVVSGTVLNVVSCAEPGSVVYQSAPVSATYTLNTSSVAFTPAGGAQTGSIPQVSVALVPETTPPNGNPTTPTSGATTVATICWSTTMTAAPATCPTMAAPAAGWTCQYGSSASFPIVPSGTDLAVDTTYHAFACKAGVLASAVVPITYTFTAYSHTITFTGLPADFTAGREQIAASNGASAYVSWDTSFLYVGYDKGPNVTANNQYVHFYIGGATGGTSTADTVVSTVPDPATPPANTQFHIFLGTNGSGVVIAQGADVFGASGWTAIAGVLQPVIHNTGSTFYEFKVALTPLGLTTLRLAGRGYDAMTGGFGTWPGPNALTSYQNEVLSSAKDPNDPTNVVP